MKRNFTYSDYINYFTILFRYVKKIPVKLYTIDNEYIYNTNKNIYIFDTISHLGQLYPEISIEDLYKWCIQYAEKTIYDKKTKELDIAIALFLDLYYIEFKELININSITNIIIRTLLMQNYNICSNNACLILSSIIYSITNNINLALQIQTTCTLSNNTYCINTKKLNNKDFNLLYIKTIITGCKIIENANEYCLELISKTYNDYKFIYKKIYYGSIFNSQLRKQLQKLNKISQDIPY